MQAGSSTSWFLLDTSRAIRPIIWQERQSYDFQTLNSEDSDTAFFRDEYHYGIRARCNAGFGLWQLAFGSKADLSVANYEAARTVMQSYKGDNGKLLGIRPTTLVVPSSLESRALHLVKSDRLENGASNIWKDSVDLIVTSYLD